MQVLRECAKIFGKMLSKPKVATGSYVPSVYNYMKELEETVLTNTLSRCIVTLTEADKAILAQRVIAVDAADCSETVRKMIELRILVREDEDELKYYMQVYELMYALKGKQKKNFYKIFTTMACNARCFYCFEQGAEPKTMTDETADAVFDYIMRTKHDKQITLYWFGGEPLCNVKVITRLCEKLRDAKVDYVSKMITNGLLFDDKLAEEAVRLWNLQWCQITLDGMSDEYKKRKNYKGNIEDPFRIVTDNIERLAKKDVKVVIRMNVDTNNVDSILELKTYLQNRYGKYSCVQAYPAMIMDEWFGYANPISQEKRKKLFDKYVEIGHEVDEAGLQGSKGVSEKIPQARCMANNRTTAIISPDGKLFTCQSHDDAMSYGDVWNGITKPELYEKWTHNGEPMEKCKTCPLLPECTAFHLCPTGTKNCKSERFNSFDRKLKISYEMLKTKEE